MKLLFALLLCALVSACGGGGDPAPSSSSGSGTAPSSYSSTVTGI